MEREKISATTSQNIFQVAELSFSVGIHALFDKVTEGCLRENKTVCTLINFTADYEWDDKRQYFYYAFRCARERLTKSTDDSTSP